MFSKRKKKFRILLEGANLLIELMGIEKLGYYTTRFVEGFDAEEASEYALDLARNELNSLGVLLNDIDDPPVIMISNVTEIASFRGIDVPGKGFAFFPEDESGLLRDL